MGRRNATNVSVTNDLATLDVDHGNSVLNNTSSTKTETTIASKKVNEGVGLTLVESETLKHIRYDEEQDQIVADRAIETTLNSLFLGEQHKMSSGAENIFFTNLGNDTNFFPMWGGLKDQSIVANQGSDGYIPPSGRVYTDMFSLPLGGNPDPLTSTGYTGPNYFAVSIAGLGITTTCAEEVEVGISLEYKLSVNDVQVYKQILHTTEKRYPGDIIEWFFDHPVEIHAGTTIFAEIRKVDRTTDTDYGVLQVRQGDEVQEDGSYRYQAIVHNRLFEDKDLELISPYQKYKTMDFGLDSTGATILLRDLSLGADSLLQPHAVNTLEAIANGTDIQIKIKGGAKIIIESLPVSGASIDGVLVNSILNQAIIQLNETFTNMAGFLSTDNFVNDFVLSGDDLTISLNDGTSYSVDVTSLGVDENKFVSSATLNNNILTLQMNDNSSLFVDATSLAIDNDTQITSGAFVGDELQLTTNNGSIIVIDASTLSTDTNLNVVSGEVVGDELVLELNDGTQIDIDVSNMINGAQLSATNDQWYISYGTNANTPVGIGSSTSTQVGGIALNQQGPYYFGQKLKKGEEFHWSFNGSQQLRLGIWDGPEEANSYSPRQVDVNNWSTCFAFLNGQARFVDSTNTNAHTVYGSNTLSFNDPMVLRFSEDGHLTLFTIESDGSYTTIAKTVVALAINEFNLQIGGWDGLVFPNGIIKSANWTIVHDFDNSEGGIINGIEDHTVIKSNISIEKGEKIMFMLDEVGQSDFFGTNYTNASTGVATAEEQLDNIFKYETNEALNFNVGGASDWDVNTNATYYFNNGAGVIGYRKGTSGTSGTGVPQGMFSLRFTEEGKLTIYSEDNNEKVATAKMDPQVGSSISLHFGVRGNRAYYSIPTISKQVIGQGSQPIQDFAPVVVDQSINVTEGNVLNYQIISSNNIVNQFVEVDAPSWMSLNQTSGVLSGTAPAYVGSSADVIVVNCKAGNAIGGTTEFTITVTIDENVSYTNSNSLQFGNASTVIQGNASNISALQRSTNGSGASDAWSISLWVKPSNNSNQETIFHYGGTDVMNNGGINIFQFSGGNLGVTYGMSNNFIGMYSVNLFTLNQWNHVLLTYDGGTTGNSSAELSSYYSRFGLFINGNNAISQFSQQGNGYTGSILGQEFKFGKYTNGTPQYFNGIINQIGIWDSDQSSNVATIYNSGATQDLSLLSNAPNHYYEIENSITNINDISGSANLLGYNFSNSDLVTDTP